jgi:hypothetical protein
LPSRQAGRVEEDDDTSHGGTKTRPLEPGGIFSQGRHAQQGDDGGREVEQQIDGGGRQVAEADELRALGNGVEGDPKRADQKPGLARQRSQSGEVRGPCGEGQQAGQGQAIP